MIVISESIFVFLGKALLRESRPHLSSDHHADELHSDASSARLRPPFRRDLHSDDLDDQLHFSLFSLAAFPPATYSYASSYTSPSSLSLLFLRRPTGMFCSPKANSSRKVAAASGDARRALEICRRAAELADYRVKNSISIPKDGKCLVGMGEVEAAIQEMFQAPHIQVMRNCSKLSKVFLVAMVHELYKTGMSETTFEKLAQIVSSLCTSNGITFPGWDTLLRIGCKLGESRIILCESGASHRFQKLQLNFLSDDVSFALKDSKELPWLTKYM
ncbi:hypothetical protein LXL04_013587 [Taraxacum kok-saghyz]